MPITTTPISVTTQIVTTETIQANKMHCLKFAVSDPTRLKPTAEILLQPYSEDEYGVKTFSNQLIRLNTADLYAAAANMAAAGYTKPATELPQVFEAIAEWVQYLADRKADLATASATQFQAQTAYGNAVQANADNVAELKAAKDLAEANYNKAQLAANDPANPKV